MERAECLARGAALKWASGVFCRPEHLERLGQYRKRESQRTASIHSRLKVNSKLFHYIQSYSYVTAFARNIICSVLFYLKSVVQSYLEGVDWGLGQLREAREELSEASHDLHKAKLESRKNSEEVSVLETLREMSISHRQLLAAVSNLPRLYKG